MFPYKKSIEIFTLWFYLKFLCGNFLKLLYKIVDIVNFRYWLDFRILDIENIVNFI